VVQANHSCDFCTEAQSDSVRPEFVSIIGGESRTLLKFPGLYVIPTLSPIVANHVLIIPKTHVTSRLQLDPASREQLTAAENYVRKVLASPANTVMTFEHGIGIGMTGGCGVSHLHVHMMPLECHVAERAQSLLQQSKLGEGSAGLLYLSSRDSYVYMRCDTAGILSTLVRTGDFPSQFLRNLIEDASGMPRTNWRDMVRSELLRETLMAPHWT